MGIFCAPDKLPENTSEQDSSSARAVVVWSRAAIKQLAGDRIHDILWKMRKSRLPRTEYGRLEALLKDAFSADGGGRMESSGGAISPRLLLCAA